jgi:hypothetical protein
MIKVYCILSPLIPLLVFFHSCSVDFISIQVVEKTIRPCLAELNEDPDVDVRYFSNQALQAIDHVMMSS